MKQMSLKSITVRKGKHIKQDDQQLPFAIQMCKYIKESRPIEPHTHILTNITYIHTVKSGWTYLLTFMNMYSRKILVWDLSANMSASWLTKIKKSLINRYKTIEYIHSDHGSQYT
jgi:putative transposase